MDSDALSGEYETLRAELDAAYTAPQWDSERIDGIADRLLPIERALARHVAESRPEPADDAG